MTLKAILFDFDGTLANSEEAHRGVWNRILAAYGTELGEQEYKRDYAGLPVPAGAHKVRKARGLAVDELELIERKTRLTAEVFASVPVELMPHAREALEWARGRGLRLALVTGTARAELTPTLDHHGLAGFFECVVTRDDVAHSKPDPESYLRALELLGLPASAALAIEDTCHGVQAADAAELEVVAIPNDYSRDHDFGEASFIADGLPAALDWIERERLGGTVER